MQEKLENLRKLASFWYFSYFQWIFLKLLILNDTAVASEKNEHTYKPQLGAIDSWVSTSILVRQLQTLNGRVVGRFKNLRAGGQVVMWNLSIYNIISWFAGPMGQTTRWPSLWCTKYYFFPMKSCKSLCKNPFNLSFLLWK